LQSARSLQKKRDRQSLEPFLKKFESAYHLDQQIKRNEKIKTKLLVLGAMPEELKDISDELLEGMSDNKKAFLAKVLEEVDPKNNIYKDSLLAHHRDDLIKRYKIESSALTSQSSKEKLSVSHERKD